MMNKSDLIAQYCQRPSEEIFGQLLSTSTMLEEYIVLLQAPLTTTDSFTRGNAFNLLDKLLSAEQHSLLPLPSSPTHTSLLQFLLNSLPNSATDLLPILLQCIHTLQQPSHSIANVLFILDHIHVQALVHSARHLVYDITLSALVSQASWQGKEMIELTRSFVNSMDGEKDPRNLVICFEIVTRLLQSVGESLPSLKDTLDSDIFDVFSCYFPITFVSPDENDNLDQRLVQGLRSCYAAHHVLVHYSLPFLLDKASSPQLDTRIECISTLIECVKQYPAESFSGYIEEFNDLLIKELLTSIKDSNEEHQDKCIQLLGLMCSIQNNNTLQPILLNVSSRIHLSSYHLVCSRVLSTLMIHSSSSLEFYLNESLRILQSESSSIFIPPCLELIFTQLSQHDIHVDGEVANESIRMLSQWYTNLNGLNALAAISKCLIDTVLIKSILDIVYTQYTLDTGNNMYIQSLVQICKVHEKVGVDYINKFILEKGISRLSTSDLVCISSVERLYGTILTGLLNEFKNSAESLDLISDIVKECPLSNNCVNIDIVYRIVDSMIENDHVLDTLSRNVLSSLDPSDQKKILDRYMSKSPLSIQASILGTLYPRVLNESISNLGDSISSVYTTALSCPNEMFSSCLASIAAKSNDIDSISSILGYTTSSLLNMYLIKGLFINNQHQRAMDLLKQLLGDTPCIPFLPKLFSLLIQTTDNYYVNPESHCIQSVLIKQKIVSFVYPLLLEGILEGNAYLDECVFILMNHSPVPLVHEHADTLVPILLESMKDNASLNTLKCMNCILSIQDEQLIHQNEITLVCKSLLGMDPKTTVTSIVLTCIQCLERIHSLYDHSTTYPVREDVLEYLKVCLCHHKRIVREHTRKCKKVWSK